MLEPTKALSTRVRSFASQLSERVENIRREHVNNVSLLTLLTAHLGIIALVLIALLLSGVELQAQQQPRIYDQPTTNGDDLPVINVDEANAQNDLRLSIVVHTLSPKKERRDVTKYAVKPG